MEQENPSTTKTEDHRVITQPSGSLASDLKNEVQQEIEEIKATGDPVNPSQSDVLVQKHVTGLAISFFILIALILLAAIGGIYWYTHTKQQSSPHPGMSTALILNGTESA